MTPDENIALVKKAYAAFRGAEIETLLSMCADDVAWERYGPPSVPTFGARRGREELRKFFVLLDQSWAVRLFEPREFIADTSQVAVIGNHSWTAKPTGRNLTAEWVHVVTLENGRITRFREFTDTAAAVAAFTG